MSDEDFLLKLGAIIFPGLLERPLNENGLRIWVEGNAGDTGPKMEAVAAFQILLGVLRAKWADAGELKEELLGGVGPGSVRDRAGNQWIGLGPAIMRVTFANEVEAFAEATRIAMKVSPRLQSALRLNGRTNRTAAEFFLIFEYAEAEFGSKEGIRQALGISVADQDRFTESANNLDPLSGGRHSKSVRSAPWDLERQRGFIASLLGGWISKGAHQTVTPHGAATSKST